MTTINFLFICGVLFVAVACARPAVGHQVCIEQACFQVEVADDTAERSQGLMHRNSLPADRGMLFIFSQEHPYSFWMKNTNIPLDILWLDYSRRVIHIEENVPPCHKDPCPHYEPANDALYVLEINAGKSRELGIQLGDQAQFRLQAGY